MIKRIELKNFKSFKNLSLELPNGFIAIVGPNGSGKSNIVDAILFVLGKSSAKKLRADKYKGLITYHKGRRENFAEVCLYFDDFGIMRRIKKNGETDYFIIKDDNKKKISKQEAIDILRKKGLMANCVISQGDLLKIINMSPIERRKIIDELSGIAEYDEKKKKAEEELNKAKKLIEKIDIRISEVKKNLEKLKKEKEDAEKYIQLNKKLKSGRYYLLKKKIEHLKNIISNLEDRINKLSNLKKEFLIKSNEIESKINLLKYEIINLDKEIQKINNGEILELHKEIKELSLEVENDKRILNRLENDLLKVENEIKNKSKELEKNKEDIDHFKVEIEKNSKELENIEEQLNKLLLEREEILSKIDEKKEIINNLKKKERLINEKISELQNKIFQLKEKLNKIEKEIYKKTLLIEKNKQKIEQLKNEMNSIEEIDTKPIYLELENLNVELNFLKKRINELEKEERNLRERLDKLYADYIKEEAKIKAYKEIEINDNIKEILKLDGVIDIVGNLGRTKEEYKKAIEVAGGQRLNYIVVNTAENAVRAIKYLKENNLGRATFLPLDRIEGRRSEKILEKGVIGRAIDLVDFDERYRKVFEYVFGNTVIVDNIDTAKELSKKYKVRFVTLDGDVVEPSGVMIGGVYKAKAKIKVDVDNNKLENIANEIKRCKNKLNNIREEKKEIEEKIKSILRRKIELEHKLDVAKDIERKNREILEKNTIIIKELSLEVEKYSKELERLKAERDEVINNVKQYEEKLDEYKKLKDEVVNEIEELENIEDIKRLNKLEKEIKEIENKRNEIYNKLNNDKVMIGVLKEKVDEIEKRLSDLKEKKRLLEENLKIYKNSIKKNMEILEKKKFTYNNLYKHVKELMEKKKAFEEELLIFKKEKEKIENKIKDIEKEINNFLIEKAKYESKLEEEEENLYLCEKIEDDELKDKSMDELESYVIQLEEEIKRLEPVNMKAIEDYEFIYNRYKELLEKRKEYEKDEKKYLKLMDEIEKKKKEVFLEVFNKVAKNFEEIYKQIGGLGKLRLENKENPFEGGLLIDASPKGKKLLSLDAMSGGEKSLTALAFLFAIQKLNYSSIYVLDEVDAALDVKNVSLIAEIIKNACKESQFIVISHREQMISKADVVYGVYMEDGLSKVVGIKL